MSNKNQGNKFQREGNPRANQNAQKLVDIPTSKTDDAKQAAAESAKVPTEETIPPKTPEPPVREGAPVEKRPMSFQEMRDMGVPAGYRNFFFSGR